MAIAAATAGLALAAPSAADAQPRRAVVIGDSVVLREAVAAPPATAAPAESPPEGTGTQSDVGTIGLTVGGGLAAIVLALVLAGALLGAWSLVAPAVTRPSGPSGPSGTRSDGEAPDP